MRILFLIFQRKKFIFSTFWNFPEEVCSYSFVSFNGSTRREISQNIARYELICRELTDHENHDVRSHQDHLVEKWYEIRPDHVLKKWSDLIWSDLKLTDHFQIISRKNIMGKIRNFYIFWEKKFPTILHVFGSALILES